MDALVDLIAGWTGDGGFHLAIGVNANVVNLMADSRAFSARVLDADLRYADGQSMVWASRLFGLTVPERVATTDLAAPLAARLAAEGRRMFFLGGGIGVAESAAERLRALIPDLLVRTSDGFRGPGATPDVVREIREFGTHVLLVGMGDPTQLDFVTANREALGPVTVLTCGGLFDWLSGRMHRAPRWMIAAGLEWLWRLGIEPRRLFRRYVVGNPRFVLRAAALRLGVGPAARAAEPFGMPGPTLTR
jgi:N-acetylglucosaminyldiphosphoundecaprenol N-acetyl-beta-D-mannosaminyltransferase